MAACGFKEPVEERNVRLEKVLARLHELEAAGEVQQVGKHWSTERPSTDLEAAFDRLQARTGNLRIVREREPVS